MSRVLISKWLKPNETKGGAAQSHTTVPYPTRQSRTGTGPKRSEPGVPLTMRHSKGSVRRQKLISASKVHNTRKNPETGKTRHQAKPKPITDTSNPTTRKDAEDANVPHEQHRIRVNTSTNLKYSTGVLQVT